MIEREFLFWVIFYTSLISYSVGYFLWLFVHWYIPDKELKTRTFKVYKDEGELRLGLNTTRNLALEEISSKSPWPGNVMVSNYSWDRRTDEIEVTVTFVSYKDPKVMPQLNTKVVTPDPRLSPVKTSGEPKLWKILSPKGQYLCHISAEDSRAALAKYFKQQGMFIEVDSTSYRAVEDKPTSPPPPPPLYGPSPLYNHLFHYERKPNA